jgi:hypothetical protein
VFRKQADSPPAAASQLDAPHPIRFVTTVADTRYVKMERYTRERHSEGL